MSSPAANRVPDEIVSEILTPLLKHSDEVFSDLSEKPLIDPGYSSSTYLLVCKAWLRVSTPLLYNVVILRTTAQAEVLQAVLKTNKAFGLFIKKLRVEGGFGNAMHTILECAPNITDMFLTLFIGGTDNVKGLCSGLPLVNPRRVILVDALGNSAQPRKNKKVTELLETLLSVIPKWYKLQTFQFPYIAGFDGARDSTVDPRAKSLASALAKSQSLETLIVPFGNSFPGYLFQFVNVPSLKSLHFTLFKHVWGTSIRWALDRIHEAVDKEPRLKALITYDESTDDDNFNFKDTDEDAGGYWTNDALIASVENEMWKSISRLGPICVMAGGVDAGSVPRAVTIMNRGEPMKLELDEHGNYFSPEKSYAYANSLAALKQLGDTIGGAVKNISVSLREESGTIDPTILTPFISLIRLVWGMDNGLLFATPAPEFSALPLLEELSAGDESFFNFVRQSPICFVKMPIYFWSARSLNSLREVNLSGGGDVPATIAFLQCHGAKLEQLAVTLEIIIKGDVFNLCTNLKTLVVDTSYYKLSDEFKVSV
ncbi:hypothetical protein GGX14DRAFT_647382 [Mycena pura]|uniref:Uncharacterized protein n=1 Tax=Mycena pura TaxID=153505 RepID=A0AAD6V6S0_9AGAR|nr:hypothetical protein GGX14DRAFT_647382 [Mycena pura]